MDDLGVLLFQETSICSTDDVNSEAHVVCPPDWSCRAFAFEANSCGRWRAAGGPHDTVLDPEKGRCSKAQFSIFMPN